MNANKRDVNLTLGGSGVPLAIGSVYGLKALDVRDLAGNLTTNTTAYFICSGLAIATVTPENGGNCGQVTVCLTGNGFQSAAAAKLRSGQSDITGTALNVSPDGTSLCATFDLNGAAQGSWDLCVDNAGFGSICLENRFWVEACRPAVVAVTMGGPASIGANNDAEFQLCYINNGNVDALSVDLAIAGIPLDALLNIVTLSPASTVTSDGVQQTVGVDFTESPLAPGAIRCFLLQITAPIGQAPFTLVGSVTSPNTASSSLDVVVEEVNVQMLGQTSIGAGRRTEFKLAYVNNGITTLGQAQFSISGIPNDVSLEIVTDPLPPGFSISVGSETTIAFTDENLNSDETKYFVFAITAPPGHAPFTLTGSLISPNTDSSSLAVNVVASVDPNDKYGSPGVGAAHYISGTEKLSYQISFENKPSATAPAQEVLIIDALDVSKLDLSTFSLGPISFGSTVVNPPLGSKQFTTQFPLDLDGNPSTTDDVIDLRIEAELIDNPLDSDYGKVFWRFNSLDPATGELPANPFLGFLPPNVIPPQGDGAVLFSVRPKAGLSSGDILANDAGIFFDLNPEIRTPVWVNAIDKTRPESQVLPLDAAQTSTTFPVSWTGTDAHSGIEHFTLFVSVDGGPFTIHVRETTATSASFVGAPGRNYSFYTVATDRIGLIELAPATGDATTRTPGPRIVAIDIKPGSFPNSIRLGSGGTVPVAIFSSALLDATQVNPETVTLADANVKLKGKGTWMTAIQDVNGDGRLDLVVHVLTSALTLSETDTVAVLQGQTFGGEPIRGSDSVRIVP